MPETVTSRDWVGSQVDIRHLDGSATRGTVTTVMHDANGGVLYLVIGPRTIVPWHSVEVIYFTRFNEE